MPRYLIAIALTAVVALAAACGSGDDEGSVASLPTADISSFPTPSGSRATPTPEPALIATAATAQSTQATEVLEDAENVAADAPPLTPEELQELRARLQSGELSEDEAQEVFERLRSQFGGGQGGPGRGGLGPGGLAGSQAVGTIESIDGNTLIVTTELAEMTATLGANTITNITSVLGPSALTDDTQVIVVSERVDGINLARTITILSEEQAGFGRGAGGLGGLGGGQAGPDGQGGLELGAARPLAGSVTSATAGGFTLETQQGPLPVSVDEETLIIETRQESVAELEAGMRVIVVGQADEEGVISALAVNVVPEGLDLENTRGFGGGGRNAQGRDEAGP